MNTAIALSFVFLTPADCLEWVEAHGVAGDPATVAQCIEVVTPDLMISKRPKMRPATKGH